MSPTQLSAQWEREGKLLQPSVTLSIHFVQAAVHIHRSVQYQTHFLHPLFLWDCCNRSSYCRSVRKRSFSPLLLTSHLSAGCSNWGRRRGRDTKLRQRCATLQAPRVQSSCFALTEAWRQQTAINSLLFHLEQICISVTPPTCTSQIQCVAERERVRAKG